MTTLSAAGLMTGLMLCVATTGCHRGGPAIPVRLAAADAAGAEGRAGDAAGEGADAAAADGEGTNFSLTIYSTADPARFSPQELMREHLFDPGKPVIAPGYGVVREVRRIDLQPGENRVEFTDVAAGIDPTTVAFQSLTAPDTTAVLEQNFEYDLTSPVGLLHKYIGREVVLRLKPTGDGKPGTVHRGRLLAFEGSSYSGLGQTFVLETAGGGGGGEQTSPVLIQRGEVVESIGLADAGEGMVNRPTLHWSVRAERGGAHDAQITYQTDGLTWRADYNLLLSADEKTADLSAWVTVLNGSGMTYRQAKLKLVAGDVQRFEPERRGGGGGAGLFGGEGGGDDEGFEEKGFFEYHLYTLGRRTTLPNNSTKQIELFPPKNGVGLSKVFVYYGLAPEDRDWSYDNGDTDDASFGTRGNKSVDIYARLRNSAANRLGVPLPAGRMRLYKTDEADGSREFIGEDIIRHTPKDEDVLIRVGSAFDLVGERVQTEFTVSETEHVATERFEITLRNHKTEPVRVVVKENLYRWVNWEITASSDKWEKQDFRTIHIPVDVPPDGEKKVTYTVKYTW